MNIYSKGQVQGQFGHFSEGLTRDLGVVEVILRDRHRFFEEIRDGAEVREKTRAMLVSSTAFLAVYGAVLGSTHSLLQAISSATKLPILFLITLTICVPALYIFSVHFGSNQRLRQSIALVLAAITVTAVVLLSLFIVIERRVSQPILDLGLFRSRIFASGVVSMGIMFLCISANTFLAPFYLVHGLGRSYAQSGLLLAVVSSTTIFVGPVSGWLSDKIGTRILCTIGMTLISLALFLLSRLGTESTTLEIIFRFVILGFGLGLFSAPNNSSIMGSVPRENLSTGSAMIATVRQVGMSSGIAIAGATFTWFTGDVPIDTLDAPLLVNAFQNSLLIAAIICSVAIITSWVRGRSKTQTLETTPSIG